MRLQFPPHESRADFHHFSSRGSVLTGHERNSVTLQGHRIHYIVRGHGRGLVLIHGLFGHSFSWRRNLDALAAHFRVYALDLPGFGYSDRPRAYSYSFASAAELVREFAASQGESRIGVVGHSMGGAVALLCAANFPDLVERLALVSPVNPFATRGRVRIAIGGTPVLGHALLAAGRVLGTPLGAFLLRYRLYGDPKALDQETIEGYMQCLRGPRLIRAIRRVFSAWDVESVRRALPTVRQPALLIWGARDRVVPVSSAHALASALGAPLQIIPAAGHLANEEAPDQVNRLLIDFFRSA